MTFEPQAPLRPYGQAASQPASAPAGYGLHNPAFADPYPYQSSYTPFPVQKPQGMYVPFNAAPGSSASRALPEELERNQPWYGVSMYYAAKRFFTKYAVISGRASRSEFWWAYLFNFLAVCALAVLPAFLSVFIPATGIQPLSYIIFLFIVLYHLGTLIPGLTLTFRRAHDSGLHNWVPITYYVCRFLLDIALFSVLMKAATDTSGMGTSRFDNYYGYSSYSSYSRGSYSRGFGEYSIMAFWYRAIADGLLAVLALILVLTVIYVILMARPTAKDTAPRLAQQNAGGWMPVYSTDGRQTHSGFPAASANGGASSTVSAPSPYTAGAGQPAGAQYGYAQQPSSLPDAGIQHGAAGNQPEPVQPLQQPGYGSPAPVTPLQPPQNVYSPSGAHIR